MKLYSLRYSPYVRKVQMLLDLLGRPYQLSELGYSDRRELAEVTGGYIYVPVLVADDGSVHLESRHICQWLLSTSDAAVSRGLVPGALEGPIWAYADFCDGPLEDVLFRIASPVIRDLWQDAGDRALYTLIKERKFGTGCIDAWRSDRETLLARARDLLQPTLATLSQVPFIFGTKPTLADAAFYGQLAMLFSADPALVGQLSPALPSYMARLEAARPQGGAVR
jgi:glutathione S-transferase